MKDEIRELALQAATAEALELVLEVRELKANLSLELQAARDDRQAQAREWRQFMEEMRGELTRIKADFRTDATLLHLIEPPKAGEFADGTEEERQGGREAQGTEAKARGDAPH